MTICISNQPIIQIRIRKTKRWGECTHKHVKIIGKSGAPRFQLNEFSIKQI